MRCDICGKNCGSLFKVNHRDLGQVKICRECWEEEWDILLRSGGCCCCN